MSFSIGSSLNNVNPETAGSLQLNSPLRVDKNSSTVVDPSKLTTLIQKSDLE